MSNDEAFSHRRHILLVDDHEVVREILGNHLEGLGYRITQVGHGVEALEQIENRGEIPDLVVSDVGMPEMGGPELARRIHGIHPELPVLLISGFIEGELADLSCLPGVVGILQKPVALPDLAEMVHFALASEPFPRRSP